MLSRARIAVQAAFLYLCTISLVAANPLHAVLADFESGSTSGAAAVTAANSSSTGASNSVVANVTESGSKRLGITDADGTYNGVVITFANALPGPGYYLITADVKVDNPGGISTFGMAVREGGPSTAKVSDENAGYVMNLTGTGDAALGYQTIGAAVRVAAGGTFPKALTVYFGSDPSGNSYNASIYDGNYSGGHRNGAATWPAGTSNAVYVDNIKRIGPGNFGEERHLWLSIGDGYTDLNKLDELLVQAKNNNFNCINILARFRADAYYIPNRTDSTHPNPEPLGMRIGPKPVTPDNDPLQYAIDRGRELGLKVYAAFGLFLVSPNSTYPSTLPAGSVMWFHNSGSPRAMLHNDPGAEGLWADFCRADVRNYTRNILLDLVTNYDVDGVIFDRVRVPNAHYSYNPQGLAEMGVSGTPSPTDATFRTKRREALTTFLKESYESVTSIKPWVVVGSAPIAFGESMVDTYNSVLQFWPMWSSRPTANRAISFGVMDLYQPQFYRMASSGGAAANTTLMKKAQYGDIAAFSLDMGLMPGAMTAIAPLLYHPNAGDVTQSNVNAQNITDSRGLAMNGFGLYPATQTLADISSIRAPGASTAGTDVLGAVAPFTDYLMKAGYDNVPPNPVNNFTAAANADGTVQLAWTAPAAAADGETPTKYLIYRSKTSPVREFRDNLVTFGNIAGSATSYLVPTNFAGSYFYKIVPVDDYNNRGTSRTAGPVTVAGEPAPPADVIVDNTAATFTGSWTAATSAADKYGADYRFKSPGTGTAVATFTATLPQAGTWEVSEWHCAGTNRATNARHIVNHSGGSTTYFANQTVNGGRWNTLGAASFTSGAWSVTIDDVFSGTVVIADAIRFAFVVQPPAAPTGLTATAFSQTAIDLAWSDNASNERHHIVSRATASGGPYTDRVVLGINVTSFRDTGLSANSTYYYRVRATNSGGDSANSNTASTATLPNAPAAPSGLAATAASSSQINLTWTDNASNETNFVVARGTTSGGPYTDIATLGANVTSFSNTGLAANTTYHYVVRATNSGGASANSNQASATTLPNAPAAPGSLAATAASSSQINLTWTDNAGNETNHVVARATTSGGPYTDIATLGANVTSFSNTGLAANTTYHYVVRATNAGGASANSNQASATTLVAAPAAPSGLTATAASSSQINLAWTDNSGNETNFVVARSTTTGGPYTDIATLGANVTSFSNTGLAANTTYHYVVRTTNAGGASANSNQASATTLPNAPAAPGSLAATAASSSQINLTWTDNASNETNFVVARSTTSGGPYTTVATLGANVTSFSNTGLAANTTYHYVVRATNAGGASANSNQASALTWPAEVIVDNTATGFTASANWLTSTNTTDKYGTDFRHRNTAAVSDTATWSFTVPQTRQYEVYAWWSQGTNRSTTAPYIVAHAGGTTTVNRNQQANGGSWQSLGTFTLNAGTNNVRLSCWTTTGFVVVADAVRIVPR